MPVDGNLAGLMFVIGSVVIVLLGLPVAGLFLIATGAGGLVVSVGLLWWHRTRRHS